MQIKDKYFKPSVMNNSCHSAIGTLEISYRHVKRSNMLSSQKEIFCKLFSVRVSFLVEAKITLPS